VRGPACEAVIQRLEEMMDLVAESPERGFVLCADEGDLYARDAKCERDACIVEYPICPEVSNPIASFHTHPKGTSVMPSDKDVKADKEAGVFVSCIGVDQGDGMGRIRCVEAKEFDIADWEPCLDAMFRLQTPK